MISLNILNKLMTTSEIYIQQPQKFQGINPMGIVETLSDSFLHNWIDELLHVMFINQLFSILIVFLLIMIKLIQTTINKKNLGMFEFNPFNVLLSTSEITNTGPSSTTFHKPAGEENQYFRLGYVPLTLC